jgi:Tfp pilus assembly protein PilW
MEFIVGLLIGYVIGIIVILAIWEGSIENRKRKL